MAVVEDETRKQLAAGSEEQGFSFRTSFDPFNMIMQQLGRLDDKLGKLEEKIDTKIEKLDAKIDGLRQEVETKIDGLHREVETKIDGLHQELHNTTRWIIGTIVAASGVVVAVASWLLR